MLQIKDKNQRTAERTAQSQEESEEVIFGMFWKTVCQVNVWVVGKRVRDYYGLSETLTEVQTGQNRSDGRQRCCLCWAPRNRNGVVKMSQWGDGVGRDAKSDISGVVWPNEGDLDGASAKHQN